MVGEGEELSGQGSTRPGEANGGADCLPEEGQRRVHRDCECWARRVPAMVKRVGRVGRKEQRAWPRLPDVIGSDFMIETSCDGFCSGVLRTGVASKMFSGS